MVTQDVEYHCVLAKAPPRARRSRDLKGTVEPTVDATKHVNGGCRSLTSDGREWQCYIGQAAVDQKIVGQGFLGEYAPSPGRRLSYELTIVTPSARISAPMAAGSKAGARR